MAFLDFGEFFRRLMTPAGTGGAEAQAIIRQSQAEKEQTAALAAQEEAKRRAELAAIPPIDKESTRLASESQMRKLLRGSGFNFSGSPLGVPPLGFAQLLGM
jgi:hypothetical protein